MAKKLEELEDGVQRLLEDDRSFEDKEKFAQLQNVIGEFLEECESRDQVREIQAKLRKLINFHPVVEENTDALEGQGMNILQMGIPYSINSGVVTVMKNVTEALDKRLGNVAIVNHWWHEYSYWDEETQQQVNVEISPFCLLSADGDLLKLRWSLPAIAEELKQTYNYTPEVCHVHTHTFYHDNALKDFDKHFNNVPVVYTLHQFIPYFRLPSKDKERLIDDQLPESKAKQARTLYEGREQAQEKMMVFADKIITINEVHQEAVEKIYPKLSHKAECIPNGTDFDKYDELESVVNRANELRDKYAPNGERIMIYVGRIEEDKTTTLPEGFNLVAAEFPDVQLVLIGADDDELEKLKKSGLNAEYQDRVHFTGWIDDEEELAAHYRMADVMVQPVFTENLYAMVSLEAMMLETPVISCPGEFTVGKSEEPEDILEAAQKVFNNEEAMQRHRKQTKEKVIKEHSMEAVYEKHMELYRNCTTS